MLGQAGVDVIWTMGIATLRGEFRGCIRRHHRSARPRMRTRRCSGGTLILRGGSLPRVIPVGRESLAGVGFSPNQGERPARPGRSGSSTGTITSSRTDPRRACQIRWSKVCATWAGPSAGRRSRGRPQLGKAHPLRSTADPPVTTMGIRQVVAQSTDQAPGIHLLCQRAHDRHGPGGDPLVPISAHTLFAQPHRQSAIPARHRCRPRTDSARCCRVRQQADNRLAPGCRGQACRASPAEFKPPSPTGSSGKFHACCGWRGRRQRQSSVRRAPEPTAGGDRRGGDRAGTQAQCRVTGETGCQQTMVVQSLGLLFRRLADPRLVRTGAGQARRRGRHRGGPQAPGAARAPRGRGERGRRTAPSSRVVGAAGGRGRSPVGARCPPASSRNSPKTSLSSTVSPDQWRFAVLR